MNDTMLRGFWYLAVSGRELRQGATRAVTLLGRQMLIGRGQDGAVFALEDSCPHRGMPLRHGSFDGQLVRCCYHGWAFRPDGQCTEIPSAAPGDGVDPTRFRVRTHPCREVQGNVWVFCGDGEPPEVPTVPGFEGVAPQVTATMRFACGVDLAAMGFFDPGHPAFVHTSRWWKRDPASRLRIKEKRFEPDRMGFRMASHTPVDGANPYRLLGRDIRIDISIQLPGTRIESIQGSRHSACVLAAATPITETETDVHYCVYWTVPWLAPLRPLAAWMTRDFLGQDRDIAARLMDNPAPPAPLFVGDADTQVRWYLRLKREFLESAREQRPFQNPLRAKVLHWRS